MQVHIVVAIVLPPAIPFSYMLNEIFLANKISVHWRLWHVPNYHPRRETQPRNHNVPLSCLFHAHHTPDIPGNVVVLRYLHHVLEIEVQARRVGQGNLCEMIVTILQP